MTKKPSAPFLEYKLPLDELEEAKLWVLELSGGEVVGVAGLELYGNQGLLRSVAVADGMHNRGYGAALANYVIVRQRRVRCKNCFCSQQPPLSISKNWDSKKKAEKQWSAAL